MKRRVSKVTLVLGALAIVFYAASWTTLSIWAGILAAVFETSAIASDIWTKDASKE